MKKFSNLAKGHSRISNNNNFLEISLEFYYSDLFQKMKIRARILYLYILNKCDLENTKIVFVDNIDFKEIVDCSKNDGIKYLNILEENGLIKCIENEIHLIKDYTKKCILGD